MYGKLEIPFSSTPSPILTESPTTNGTVAACAALTHFSPVLVRLPSTNDATASYGVNQRSVGCLPPPPNTQASVPRWLTP